ncbi:enoyl-CoA hydratase/isomerase family protein [Achromobacter xylosoxidans]
MPTITQPYQTLLHTCEDGVATITLNRPAQRNALDMVMREELAHAVDAIRRDREVRVVILGGAGGAFCAGGDIGTMDADPSAEHARERMVRLLFTVEALITLDRSVIAKVDGAAYGAGLGLALTADLVLATPRARFCLSFLRLGAIPDCGTLYTLPRIVGLQRAKELAYSAREFNAEEARDMGIVLDILPPERIDAHARQIALAMAGLPYRRAVHHQARPERLAEQRPAHHDGAGSLGAGRGALVALPPRGRRTLPGQTGAALSVAKVLKMAAVLNAGGAPRATPSRRVAAPRSLHRPRAPRSMT